MQLHFVDHDFKLSLKGPAEFFSDEQRPQPPESVALLSLAFPSSLPVPSLSKVALENQASPHPLFLCNPWLVLLKRVFLN